MNNKLKMMLLLLCAAALVAAGIFGTLAYFTDSDAVTNTFTVGQVRISLDEAKVNADGTKIENADRVQNNEYHLIPGSLYEKDPTVHVEANSEDAWLFVEVLNEIKIVEAENADDYICIEEQITKNGWTKLESASHNPVNVYYQAHAKDTAIKDYVVFANFKIDGNKAVSDGKGDKTNTFNITDFGKAVVTVKAYAIQMAGFEGNVSGAWTALQSQRPNS